LVRDDSKAIEMRRVKVGQTSAKMVEILEGLVASDRVITRGSLFIDRVAAAGR
jgi:membrane fusion protein, heavy metal efflux system